MARASCWTGRSSSRTVQAPSCPFLCLLACSPFPNHSHIGKVTSASTLPVKAHHIMHSVFLSQYEAYSLFLALRVQDDVQTSHLWCQMGLRVHDTHFETPDPGATYLSTLTQAANGTLTMMKTEPIDWSAYDGIWVSVCPPSLLCLHSSMALS
jgi:hypothetical protein